jgi:hypothetical protein
MSSYLAPTPPPFPCQPAGPECTRTYLSLTPSLPVHGADHPGIILRGLCLSTFGFSRNLPNHMDRASLQGCNRDTVLVKSREMRGRSQTLPCWLGEGGKDDKNEIHWPLRGRRRLFIRDDERRCFAVGWNKLRRQQKNLWPFPIYFHSSSFSILFSMGETGGAGYYR